VAVAEFGVAVLSTVSSGSLPAGAETIDVVWPAVVVVVVAVMLVSEFAAAVEVTVACPTVVESAGCPTVLLVGDEIAPPVVPPEFVPVASELLIDGAAFDDDDLLSVVAGA
jgi:hypothetical protein